MEKWFFALPLDIWEKFDALLDKITADKSGCRKICTNVMSAMNTEADYCVDLQ